MLYSLKAWAPNCPLARKVLDLLQQNKKIARHYLNRTLFDPEAVWMTLLLQQRYRLTVRILNSPLIIAGKPN